MQTGLTRLIDGHENDVEVAAIHVVGSLHPGAGGPPRTVVQLTDALADVAGLSVTLISQTMKGAPTIGSANHAVHRVVVETRAASALTLGLPVLEALGRVSDLDRHQLVHSHGIWASNSHWATRCARRLRIPLVVHPRGMLEPWALAYKGWKKRIALKLYQQGDLQTAELFFATAEQEAEQLRRLGLRQPIAIIPNGVRLPTYSHLSQDQKPRCIGRRTALFLSRIHPKKGLLNLLDAWGRLRPRNWDLSLVGPDEGGHLQDVMTRIDSLGLRDSVHYLGELDGQAKAEVFTRVEVLVLPSFSENFGVVVAEAMAHGVPVIATRGTPWSGLVSRGCGWWVEPTVDALFEALQEALVLDSPTLAAMGEQGRLYARDFDWRKIALETGEVYRWVLGYGPKPACVVTE